MTPAPIRTRIAPSPTGNLHIGTARTALFNYLFAKKHGGTFVLRIEDTDLERSDPKFEADILEGLSWLGIIPDEGPEQGGSFGPYRQSERLAMYTEHLKILLEKGKAFYCFHTESELAASEGNAEGKLFMPHVCEHRDISVSDAERRIAEGERAILRLRNDAERDIVFSDGIRGDIRTEAKLLGDFSLAKDIHTPLYNFAVVVDDHAMQITDVIRGEDHISNTPKQILIQEALGFPSPRFSHLPLILGPDRSKLSKRHGATSIREFREQGYLPEAIVNFMALLGWNPGTEQELFALSELAEAFDIERVQKSGAIWNADKLDWFNAEYIRKKSPPELLEYALPFFAATFPNASEKPRAFVEAVLALEQPRMKKLSDVVITSEFFFGEPVIDPVLLRWKTMTDADVRSSLERARVLLVDMPTDGFTRAQLEAVFFEAIGEGDKGAMLWPLRVALSGKKNSPGPFDIMEVLGKEETLRRIERAIEKLK